MKILHVSSSFKPSWETGGTCRVSYELSRCLTSRGHDVTVYTTDRGTKRLNIQKNKPVNVDNIRVFYFKNISNYIAMRKKIITPYYMPIIAQKELKSYDIIHIHEHRTIASVITYYYAKKFCIPYIVQAHGSLLAVQKQTYKNIFDNLIGYRILKDASKIIALNETEYNLCLKIGIPKNNIVLLQNGINLNEYNVLPKAGEFKTKYFINSNKRIILYLGRLHKTKSIDLLIQAFSKLSTEIADIILIIAGPDDGCLSELKNLSKMLNLNEKIIFTGQLSEIDKLRAYVDSDIFVTPTYSGLPIAFLEACACGIPIITTNISDKLDWIDNNVGLVVNFDDFELKNAMSKILLDKNLYNRFKMNGRLLVKNNLNWDILISKLESIYLNSKVINEGK